VSLLHKREIDHDMGTSSTHQTENHRTAERDRIDPAQLNANTSTTDDRPLSIGIIEQELVLAALNYDELPPLLRIDMEGVVKPHLSWSDSAKIGRDSLLKVHP
jgi:hypothetical protein